MLEKNLSIEFKHAIEKIKPKTTTVYELKMVKTRRFALGVVQPHQVEGLQEAKEGLWYKLADMSAFNGYGMKKPFDAIWIKVDEAYVVPIFWTPRIRKTAYLIPIEEFVKFKTTSVLEEELLKFESIDL